MEEQMSTDVREATPHGDKSAKKSSKTKGYVLAKKSSDQGASNSRKS